jgi:hypothetical protein
MASGSKTRNVFTEENMGTGKSSGIVDSKGGVDGQTIKMAYPQDNVHGLRLDNERGGPVRGGPTNISHSLKGASVVDDGPGAAGPVKHVRIKDH